jgi:hypothetical protein
VLTWREHYIAWISSKGYTAQIQSRDLLRHIELSIYGPKMQLTTDSAFLLRTKFVLRVLYAGSNWHQRLGRVFSIEEGESLLKVWRRCLFGGGGGAEGGNIEANVCVPSQRLLYPFPKRPLAESSSLSYRMHKSFMILFSGGRNYPRAFTESNRGDSCTTYIKYFIMCRQKNYLLI